MIIYLSLLKKYNNVSSLNHWFYHIIIYNNYTLLSFIRSEKQYNKKIIYNDKNENIWKTVCEKRKWKFIQN
jgi:hypothetical protein